MARTVCFLALASAGQAAPPMKWESLMLVKAAAEKGDREAQFLIGVQYKAGDGLARDRAEAAKWLRKAAEAGHAEAQYALGVLYSEAAPEDGSALGQSNVPADPVEAAKWLQAASAQGNAEAKARLETVLASQRAQSEATSRTPMPAEAGRAVPAARAGSGLPPAGSREMDEDPAETVRWSLLLCGLRGAEAFLIRGFMLENGVVVNRDLAAATDCYRKAAARGSVEAVAALARLKALPPSEPVATAGKPSQAGVDPAKKP
jgi:TPR repeat protein